MELYIYITICQPFSHRATVLQLQVSMYNVSTLLCIQCTVHIDK